MSRQKTIQYLKRELSKLNDKIDRLILNGKSYADLELQHAKLCALLKRAEIES